MSLYSMSRDVRFQDIDAAGIVFFGRVFDYFHDALTEHYAARGFDLPLALRQGAWAMPLVHAEADYRAPMVFGDRLVVVVEAADIGRTSVTVRYCVSNAEDRARVHATGKTVSAFIDRATFRPREFPDDLRSLFTEA